MITALRNALLIAMPLLLFACSKAADHNASNNQFIINGIHDISMDSSGGNMLAIGVQKTKGDQEQVTLTAENLPAGISVSFSPASGTPDFGSIVTFARTGAIAGGSYPIKLVGTSASYTKSYDLKVIVPVSSFSINGIYDVNVGSFMSSPTLSLDVVRTGGISDPVTLSLAGVPAGVRATFQPASGTPDYSSTLTFLQTDIIPAGTHPAQIIGTTATGSRSFNFNVIVPEFNGFKVDTTLYRAYFGVSKTGNTFIVSTPVANVTATISGSWPAIDGTYTFPIGSGTNEISLRLGQGSTYYNTAASTGKTATVKVLSGKLSIETPEVTVTGPTSRKLVLKASE